MDSDRLPGARTSADWRARLLAGITPRPPAEPAPNRLGWPDYDGRPALRWGDGLIAGVAAVAAVWDFSVHGGSFGETDAASFAAAAATARASRRPLVSFLRSGGTRLQEGVAGLVGLPRAALALAALDEAGIGHLAVADHPTTGGVWVTIGSRGDLRCAVAGATVGFSGPRVVAAMTGAPLPPDSHRAASALDAGLVDAALPPEEVEGWLRRALTAISPAASAGSEPNGSEPDDSGTVGSGAAVLARIADRSGWEQVVTARTSPRPDGRALAGALLPDGVDLRGSDPRVHARIGVLAESGVRAVVVAVGAERGSAPGPDGYRLLIRAARLAGKLGVGLITLVDTPGAAAGAPAEAAGIAAAIGDAMAAVLACPSPTVSIVHGEGGSGGALAAAVTDVVAMTPDSYVTALSPEGAAATLRVPAGHAADAAGLRPVDLLRLGFADRLLGGTDPATIARAAGTLLAAARRQDPARRRHHRQARWSTGLRHSL
jgi:acetyl-CoA carboxylase carboxyl transferase subunit beta